MYYVPDTIWCFTIFYYVDCWANDIDSRPNAKEVLKRLKLIKDEVKGDEDNYLGIATYQLRKFMLCQAMNLFHFSQKHQINQFETSYDDRLMRFETKYKNIRGKVLTAGCAEEPRVNMLLKYCLSWVLPAPLD